MPQMYPLNWILMFWFFSFIFYMIISMTYFFFPISFKTSSKEVIKSNKKGLNSFKQCW